MRVNANSTSVPLSTKQRLKYLDFGMGGGRCMTTDHVLLRKMKSESRLSVVDPVDFIRMLQE